MAVRDTSLFSLLRDYLKNYLPKQHKLSPNTIRSYRESLELFLDYVKKERQIPLCNVTFEMLSEETISGFLNYLESERGCLSSTRNIRLIAIRTFLNYAAERDITVAVVFGGAKKVPFKKPSQVTMVEYMSMEAVAAIAEQPDVSTEKGRRDRFFIMLMYDTGARVQEMLDIQLCDLDLGKTPKITLHGKGNKTRTVPLMEKTAKHLEKYLAEFHKDTPPASKIPLFYSVIHGEMRPLSDRRIRYILQGYAEKARQECLEVPEKVYPHLFRHSRAMHLYQEGMDLTLVSQWLGHSTLETTQIYAHADTEHKRKAIAAATPEDNPLYSKLNSARFTVTDDETLKKLTGLK